MALDEADAAAPPAGASRPNAGEGAQAATHRFHGRVLDAARRPVIGARIEPSLAGHEPWSASSGAGGGFEVAAALPGGASGVQALAYDGAASAARRQVWLRAAPEGKRGRPELEVELGPLVLLPAHGLSVRVLEGGRPAEPALVRVDLGHSRELALEEETSAEGVLELAHLLPGPVYLTATPAAADPGSAREGRALALVPELAPRVPRASRGRPSRADADPSIRERTSARSRSSG